MSAENYIIAELVFRAIDAGVRYAEVKALIEAEKSRGASPQEVSAKLAQMADDAIAKAQAEIDRG